MSRLFQHSELRAIHDKVVEGQRLSEDDALVYATQFGEGRALEGYLDSFPAASPTLFQTSIHPSGAQQGLIGRQRSVREFFPLAGGNHLVATAAQAALLAHAERVLFCGGEERGTWLVPHAAASDRAFAFALALTRARATDSIGRPLFIDGTLTEVSSVITPGRVMGRPAYLGDGIATDIVAGTPNTGGIIGFGGDWSKAVWGVVGGITYDVSTEATVTLGTDLVSLWEHNLVAIRAEAEYGWLLQDKDAFVAITNHT